MNSYRIKKERERILISSGFVLGATAFIFLIGMLFDIFKFEDFNEYTGPLKITFGSPDSTTEDVIDTNTEIPEPEEVEIPKEEIPAEVVNDVVESKSEEIVTKNKTPIEELKENKTTEPVVKEKPIIEKVPIVQKGRESGNSHETTFESTSNKIGRRAYSPISQYMPLPKIITMETFSLIDGDITGFDDKDYNRNLFTKFYFPGNNSYTLKDSVPFDTRPYLWAILEKSGFDINNADYKKDKKLKSVIIAFEINSNSSGSNSIKSADVVSSSGDPNIDAAVLYGFKQSTYSNSTNVKVKGRFKYSFQ